MSGNAKQQDLGIRPERVEQAALGCELIALVPVAGNHHHGQMRSEGRACRSI